MPYVSSHCDVLSIKISMMIVIEVLSVFIV